MGGALATMQSYFRLGHMRYEPHHDFSGAISYWRLGLAEPPVASAVRFDLHGVLQSLEGGG